MSTCPHPKCGKPKSFNQYACRRHWFSLPKKIRDAIWAGYKSTTDPELWHRADGEAKKFWGDNERL